MLWLSIFILRDSHGPLPATSLNSLLRSFVNASVFRQRHNASFLFLFFFFHLGFDISVITVSINKPLSFCLMLLQHGEVFGD